MLLVQLNLLLDQYMIAARALLDRLATRSLLDVKNVRVGSPSLADQGRPPRPLPITHTDQTRPVTDSLNGHNRFDLIGSWNT